MGILALALVLFLVVAIVSAKIGMTMLRVASKSARAAEEAPIPQARTANPQGADRVARKVRRGAGGLQRLTLRALGVALILWPWAALIALFSGSDSHESHSKGRVLRVKNRARLPELATGDGWVREEVVVRAAMTTAERRVLGELWLQTARMEHASIAAFSQLALHLAALGAPASLLTATHQAALDEIRHAERSYAIASAITGQRQAAGPIGELAAAERSHIDFTRLAIGSLVDGCLAEGMAADVAARGASSAREPIIRDTLAMIAREEVGHAELAWSVLAWCLERGGEPVRGAVAARVERLGDEVAPRLPDLPDVDVRSLASHGVVDQDALGEIAALRVAAVQIRARGLVCGEMSAARAA